MAFQIKKQFGKEIMNNKAKKNKRKIMGNDVTGCQCKVSNFSTTY